MLVDRLRNLCFALVLFITASYALRDKPNQKMDKKAAAQSVGNPGEFIPTHEWQVVQEGQAVPAGLHIKFDMTTGGKWAKLLDDGKQTSKALVLKEEGSTGVPKT